MFKSNKSQTKPLLKQKFKTLISNKKVLHFWNEILEIQFLLILIFSFEIKINYVYQRA